jgi:hypothetical protein
MVYVLYEDHHEGDRLCSNNVSYVVNKNNSDYNHMRHNDMGTNISEEPEAPIFWIPSNVGLYLSSWFILLQCQ